MIESQLLEMVLRYGFACMVTAWLLYERYKVSLSQVDSLAAISTNLALITDKLERL